MPSPRKSLLAILAHPDDESFGMGGTLARYADEGVEVHLLCATGGENGTVDPELLNGYASIAELREHELRCAAEKLGLASVTMGGYRDSGMAGTEANEHPDCLIVQPVEVVARHFAQVIRKVRPQVVVTHDPIGGYKHPDHIACNRAALRAFDLAGDPEALPEDTFPAWQPLKLYYQTIPKRWMKLFVRLLPLFRQDPRRFGRNKDIDILDLVESGDFPIHARIDYRRYVAVRDAASACHASQLAGGPPNRGLIAMLLRFTTGKDAFSRAIPSAGKGLQERDLFDSLGPSQPKNPML